MVTAPGPSWEHGRGSVQVDQGSHAAHRSGGPQPYPSRGDRVSPQGWRAFLLSSSWPHPGSSTDGCEPYWMDPEQRTRVPLGTAYRRL